VRVVVIIPARYHSRRLPAKPLLKKTDKYLIQHTYERAKSAKLIDKVIVATDSKEIADAARSFNAPCYLTSPKHKSGTSRVAEVVKKIKRAKYVINLQCDEPEINPDALDEVVRMLKKEYYCTVAAKFASTSQIENPDRVKVVINKNGYALYFSRSVIPFSHDRNQDPLLHLGIYGYTRDFLLKFIKLKPTRLEAIENLEQLRALEHGYKIKVFVSSEKSYGGIDTMEDYEEFVKRYYEGGRLA
jgi:3-deoxy-manno-octulosonate cytidylyltransferase (CMP-KDO synthetase)